MVDLDEHMTETVLTIIAAYGSFLLAEHYLHVSGVIATVVAGLFIGNRGTGYAMSPRTKISIFNTLSTGAFIVNTFIFLAIGINTPVAALAANAPVIVAAIALVLTVRIAIVYPIAAVVNRRKRREVSLSYQHVMVWGRCTARSRSPSCWDYRRASPRRRNCGRWSSVSQPSASSSRG